VLRLVWLFVSVGCLAALAWFGLTVDLGGRTLFGHLRAIGGSKESQELWRGAKAKATDALGIAKAREAMRAKLEGKIDGKNDGKPSADKPANTDDGAGKASPAAPPQDRIGAEDREAMRKLIGSAHAQNTARPLHLK
jgi:hypothetical protein